MTVAALEFLTRAMQVRAVRAEARSVDVIASTDAVDSYGEVVAQTWDLKRYEGNPVVLYAHDTHDLPIGTGSNVRVEGGALVATLNFATAAANPKAEQVWQLFKEGVLRAVSVGFYPRDQRWEKRGDREVLVLSDNELREISVVPVPANPEALARLRARAARPPTIPAAPAALTPEDTMNKELLKALGLPETATEADVMREVARLAAFARDAQAVTERASSAEVLGVLHGWKLAVERGVAATAELAALKRANEAAERAALLDGARKAGGITPADEAKPGFAEKLAAMDLGTFRLFCETVKPKVPTVPTLPTERTDAAAVALTEDEKYYGRQAGLTDEQLLTQKRRDAQNGAR